MYNFIFSIRYNFAIAQVTKKKLDKKAERLMKNSD